MSTNPPRRNCPKALDLTEASEKLGIKPADIVHYSQALARWTAAGFPMRSQAEVREIYETKCKPCEHFAEAEGRCTLCRCNVNTARVPVWNKIKMATEHCPERKW